MYICKYTYISAYIHINELPPLFTGASPVGGHAERDRGSGSVYIYR